MCDHPLEMRIRHHYNDCVTICTLCGIWIVENQQYVFNNEIELGIYFDCPLCGDKVCGLNDEERSKYRKMGMCVRCKNELLTFQKNNNKPGVNMKPSIKFIHAVKLSPTRQYILAERAGMTGPTLSGIINGTIKLRPDDRRIKYIYELGKILNLEQGECFENDNPL